jgi:hypothetical protein
MQIRKCIHNSLRIPDTKSPTCPRSAFTKVVWYSIRVQRWQRGLNFHPLATVRVMHSFGLGVAHVSVYRMRAFEQEVSVGARLWRAFDKTV